MDVYPCKQGVHNNMCFGFLLSSSFHFFTGGYLSSDPDTVSTRTRSARALSSHGNGGLWRHTKTLVYQVKRRCYSWMGLYAICDQCVIMRVEWMCLIPLANHPQFLDPELPGNGDHIWWNSPAEYSTSCVLSQVENGSRNLDGQRHQLPLGCIAVVSQTLRSRHLRIVTQKWSRRSLKTRTMLKPFGSCLYP